MNGTVIEGRYEIRSRLARGGMSTVYLAVDRRLDREVALKVLYPHLAENPALVERFELEAKTAARLSHPHVVNVLDQGVDERPDGDLAYLVMEYVPGYTLRTVLQRRRAMTPRVALAYLEAIVDGLAAAHRAGLVHRDMKPENVLVSRDGQIKVADFGLARATTDFTGIGAALVGTVAYISPELVSGSPADERSDIYAVGIMAYEMLTGRQPFVGASPIQVAYQHVNNEVPPPSGRIPGLADALDRLVLWCTAQNARDRPADAGVLLTEIRHLRSTMADADLDAEPPVIAAGMAGERSTEALGRVGTDPDDEARAEDQATEAFGAVTPAVGAGAPAMDDVYRDAGYGVDADHDEDADVAPGDATDVIGDAGATEALDPGVTTALPPPGTQRTSVLPSLPPDPGRRPGGSGQSGAGASAVPPQDRGTVPGPLLPRSSGRSPRSPRSPRPPSTRQQRRQAIRRARTPTEDLGRRSGTRMWIWAAVVLILTAVLVLAGWFFGSGPGALVVVPDVEGHSKAAAVEELQQTGVGYSLASVHHDVVAEDSVISTDPGPGTELRRFNTVLVTVSLGPELFDVPDVTGLAREEAARALAGAGLSLGRVSTEHSDTVDEGLVIRQEPVAGANLRGGRPVAVVVSDGPASVTVPDVTGQSTGRARGVLEGAGFTVEETRILGELFGDREGTVRSQSPEPGSQAPPGSTVRIVIL
ncbi:protein kinase domain-containing protein [Citricoccus zhacaiensis]